MRIVNHGNFREHWLWRPGEETENAGRRRGTPRRSERREKKDATKDPGEELPGVRATHDREDQRGHGRGLPRLQRVAQLQAHRAHAAGHDVAEAGPSRTAGVPGQTGVERARKPVQDPPARVVTQLHQKRSQRRPTGLTEPLARTLGVRTGEEKRGGSAERWANEQPTGRSTGQWAVHSRGGRGDKSRPRTSRGGPEGALRRPTGEKKSALYNGKVFLFSENEKSNGHSIIPSLTDPLCSNFS